MTRKPFTLERCSVLSPKVSTGQWVAYYTEVGGGSNRGRWLRALVIRMSDGRAVVLDEEGDLVHLGRWERVYSPPALKPDVLREWLRAMAVYPSEAGALA